jgi:hypothetical protein
MGPVDETRSRTWGRIGGLTAWSRNDSETMVGPAHAGFRRRFERLVDPEGRLDPAERTRRAERARRAYMLALAEKSAAVRSAKKKAPAPLKADAPEVDRASDHATARSS